jgi:hypothetical protein
VPGDDYLLNLNELEPRFGSEAAPTEPTSGASAGQTASGAPPAIATGAAQCVMAG